jgi:hypothetical protein
MRRFGCASVTVPPCDTAFGDNQCVRDFDIIKDFKFHTVIQVRIG